MGTIVYYFTTKIGPWLLLLIFGFIIPGILTIWNVYNLISKKPKLEKLISTLTIFVGGSLYLIIHGISHIKYDDASSELFIGFSDMSPDLDDINFNIIGENLVIVCKNGIDNKLKIGKRISVVSAPRYFGDSYVYPIVSITVDGECLLDFEVGYQNLLHWLKSFKVRFLYFS